MQKTIKKRFKKLIKKLKCKDFENLQKLIFFEIC